MQVHLQHTFTEMNCSTLFLFVCTVDLQPAVNTLNLALRHIKLKIV